MISQLLKSGGPITMDFVVLAGLLILFFAYTMYFGKSRIISAIIAFYPAVFLYKLFPSIDKFLVLKGDALMTLNEILIFLVFFVPINIIISRFIFSDSGFGSSKVLRTVGLSLVSVVLVLIFTYSVVSLDIVYNFSQPIDGLFLAGNMFYWDLAPVILLFFL